MSRMSTGALVLAALVGLSHAAITADSSKTAPSPSGGAMGAPMTPEEMAREAYNSGVRHKDTGVKAEAKAATKQGKDQQKELDKAKSEYQKALKDFKRAADLVPQAYQAYNGMGFAYRKTGDFTKALEMYDKALQLSPGFPDAIEYRGEAYLGLNRLDDAKQAYLTLFASDRKQANLLMKAMEDWVTARKTDPAGVDPAAVAAFENWIKERATLAGQTAQMALTPPTRAW